MKKMMKPVLLTLVLLCNLVEQSNGMSADKKAGVEPVADGTLDESYELIGADGATFDGNSDEGLLAAAYCGDVDLVKFFLRKKANPNAQDPEGDTVLMKAALNGNMVVVKLLLGAGAIPTARNRNGIDAMEMAGTMNHNGVMQLLTETIKIIEERENTKFDESLDQPLIAAIVRGDVDLVRDLLFRKKGKANPNAEDYQGSALMNAINAQNVKAVELLLAARADVNARISDGIQLSEYTALMHVSYDGNIAIAKLLLGAGADVNAQDCYKRTPLMIASSEGQAEIVALLLAAGASTNLARAIGYEDVVQLLEWPVAPKIWKLIAEYM